MIDRQHSCLVAALRLRLSTGYAGLGAATQAKKSRSPKFALDSGSQGIHSTANVNSGFSLAWLSSYSSVRILKALGPIDLRNVRRDSLLLWMAVMPFVFVLLFRFRISSTWLILGGALIGLLINGITTLT